MYTIRIALRVAERLKEISEKILKLDRIIARGPVPPKPGIPAAPAKISRKWEIETPRIALIHKTRVCPNDRRDLRNPRIFCWARLMTTTIYRGGKSNTHARVSIWGRNEANIKPTFRMTCELDVNFTAWKVPKYGVFSDPITGKYGPEKTPDWEIFYAVLWLTGKFWKSWQFFHCGELDLRSLLYTFIKFETLLAYQSWVVQWVPLNTYWTVHV